MGGGGGGGEGGGLETYLGETAFHVGGLRVQTSPFS